LLNRVLILLVLLCTPVWAAPPDDALLKIEDRWAQIRYEMKDKRQRLAAARDLIAEAREVVAAHPGAPEPLIWLAMALLVEAEVRGDIGALGIVKEARRTLHEAERIDPMALDGMIQTTLGMLYYETPGWPIGFGDRARARAYLTQALKINPGGKDTNYFFGDYLVMTGRGREAIPFLESAAAAPVRPGHERADTGRRADIQESLDKARKAR
jgi:hypothetical protein